MMSSMNQHPIRVVEQGKLPCDCSYWVFWSTASHDINAVYSVKNIRVSTIIILTIWYCAKSHGYYLILLPWRFGTSILPKVNRIQLSDYKDCNSGLQSLYIGEVLCHTNVVGMKTTSDMVGKYDLALRVAPNPHNTLPKGANRYIFLVWSISDWRVGFVRPYT